MFGTALAGAAIKAALQAVLGWLTGLWDRFVQKQEHVQQGREDVIDVVNEETQRIKDEFEDISRSNTDFDAAIDRLQRRATERGSKDLLSSAPESTGESSGSVKKD